MNKIGQPFVAIHVTKPQRFRAMNTTTAQPIFRFPSEPPAPAAKQVFREQFQRSLRSCIRRGFSVEEAFGMIWVETWEEISVTEQEQFELYDELIGWARNAAR